MSKICTGIGTSYKKDGGMQLCECTNLIRKPESSHILSKWDTNIPKELDHRKKSSLAKTDLVDELNLYQIHNRFLISEYKQLYLEAKPQVEYYNLISDLTP